MEYDADGKTLLEAVDKLDATAKAQMEAIEAANKAYLLAYAAGDHASMDKFWQEGRVLTAKELPAFQKAQEVLLGLMYECPIVPHEAAQENIILCQGGCGGGDTQSDASIRWNRLPRRHPGDNSCPA